MKNDVSVKPRKSGTYSCLYTRAKSRETNVGTGTYTRGVGWINVRGPYNRSVGNPTIHSWE